MKAKELIKLLEQDPEAEVLITGTDGYEEVYSVKVEDKDVKYFKRGEECNIDYDSECSDNNIVHTNVFIIS